MTASIIRRDRCCHDNSLPWADLAKLTKTWLHEWKKTQCLCQICAQRAHKACVAPLEHIQVLTQHLKWVRDTEGGYHTVGMKWPWIHQEISKNRSFGPWVHCGLITLLADDKTNNRATASYKGFEEATPNAKACISASTHEEITVLFKTNNSSHFWPL